MGSVSGGALAARMLKAEGIEYVFGLIGGISTPSLMPVKRKASGLSMSAMKPPLRIWRKDWPWSRENPGSVL